MSERRRARVEDLIRIDEHTYVLATSPRLDERNRVLKHGDTFGLFDRYGDIQPVGLGEQGFYHEGTRHLSRFEILVDGHRPMFLNSAVRRDNTLFTADLTNPDLVEEGCVQLRQTALHLFRSRLLRDAVCYERLRVTNFEPREVHLTLTLEFQADFADEFEVRWARREQRGAFRAPLVSSDGVTLAYLGLDGIPRSTRIATSPAPDSVAEDHLSFSVTLPPRGRREWLITLAFDGAGGAARVVDWDTARFACFSAAAECGARECEIESSHLGFNQWIHRSMADLHMMLTDTPQGPYPYAGVPWFSTPFGRDGLITALQYLWVDPEIARGVLRFAAAHQAAERVPERDAEPGKIFHEFRRGEMANLGEVPFGRYYGTVDATPLFVMLAGACFRRTGDLDLARELWPHVERALDWIDRYGDRDGDGFVEYERLSPRGLLQQGWKDAADSIFHADGETAEQPIALCEVQGYVYDARLQAAMLARRLGREDRAARLEAQAGELRERFHEAFWCEDLGTYALALDGRKRPCRVRTSNAGQCLLSGIAYPEQARAVVKTLFSSSSFSGWGIRTLASTEARYNPMAYHNGSVWPHDNALIALGCARYGFRREAAQILAALFDLSTYVEHRLPELTCGFVRRSDEGPTLYPVACSPQAWAAAAAFSLLQGCLGMEFDHDGRGVTFRCPALPEALSWLEIRNLRLRDAQVDLRFQRHRDDVGVVVCHQEGDPRVSVLLA